ncbi:MAG: helix-turn-helix domain-containing protein [Caulobacteraceae bacterium]
MIADDDMELAPGSGNVFRDLGLPNPELEQLRALLAAQIIHVLEEEGLSVRAAHERTGTAAADFSRIRQMRLDRFTVDRLMSILARLGREVDVSVEVRPATPPTALRRPVPA